MPEYDTKKIIVANIFMEMVHNSTSNADICKIRKINIF